MELDTNSIADVSPLSGLTGLSSLDLAGNRITSVSPLSGLSGVEGLNLSTNGITDVSPLSGLTALRRLYLRNNAIADIAALLGLTDLRQLNLDGNRITNVSPLSSLTKLDRLVLQNNSIAEIAPLSGLTGLTQLDLDDNSLTALGALSGLTNLRWLYLERNCLTSIDALTSNTGLGAGDRIGLRENALDADSLANGVTALRDRGATVLVTEAPTARVGAPAHLIAMPGNGELALTWPAPRAAVDIPAYEVRWRSAIGTFSDWSTVPCSSKGRHLLSGLVNGTTYTVELRAAGHVSNGVKSVTATPTSTAVVEPVETMLWAALTTPGEVPSIYDDTFEWLVSARGAWPMLVAEATVYQPPVYLRELEIAQGQERGSHVEIALSTTSTGLSSLPPWMFGWRVLFSVHDVGLNEALLDEDGLPLVQAQLNARGEGRFAGTLEGELDTFWAAISDSGDYDWSEGLYVELRP